MEDKNYKLKIFFWDQFIRPLKKISNRHTIQSLLIALAMLNFFTFNNVIFFWVSMSLILIISFIDVREYWVSGKYIGHYRREKYPDYKSAVKKFKKKGIIEEDKKAEEPLSLVGYGEPHDEEKED